MRSVYLSAGILVISLSGAWLRFTMEPDKIGENEVLVMANQADRIQEISWKSEKQDVTLKTIEDAQGKYLWVQYTDKRTPDALQERYFKAGPNGEKLLKNLSPLVGIRKLNGDIESDSLGFGKPSATLQVTSNDQIRTFTIGDESYGTRDLYVRDDQSQEIFLIDDAKLRSLRQARTSLPDRSLWANDSNQTTSATLTLQTQSLKLTHKDWQDRGQSKWVKTDNPQDDSTQIETWMTKVLRVSVSQYAKPDEDLSSLTEVFSCTLHWDESLDTATFYKHEDDSWWAQTTHTRGKVKLAGNALDGLVDDLPSIFQP